MTPDLQYTIHHHHHYHRRHRHHHRRRVSGVGSTITSTHYLGSQLSEIRVLSNITLRHSVSSFPCTIFVSLPHWFTSKLFTEVIPYYFLIFYYQVLYCLFITTDTLKLSQSLTLLISPVCLSASLIHDKTTLFQLLFTTIFLLFFIIKSYIIFRY